MSPEDTDNLVERINLFVEQASQISAAGIDDSN